MSARAKQKDAVATRAQAAAIEFEPWTLELTELPSNKDFGKRIVVIRLAAAVMNRTKPELMKMVSELAMQEEGGEGPLSALLHDLKHDADYFRAHASMLDEALRRLKIAICTQEVEEAKRDLSPLPSEGGAP
jgi:hypothetical protein